MWHRLFGQDVTLWGPTHLMLIGGAGMTLVGQAVLLAEGMRARPRRPRRGAARRDRRASRACAASASWAASSSACRRSRPSSTSASRSSALVFQPFLIALAAGVALVAGAHLDRPRRRARRGASSSSSCAARSSLLAGPRVRRDDPSLPLYLGEALRRRGRRAGCSRAGRCVFGAVGGAAHRHASASRPSTRGRQVALPLPWTRPAARGRRRCAVAGGVAGGMVGALLALGLRGELPRPAVARDGAAPRRRRSSRVRRDRAATSRCRGRPRAVELTDVAAAGGRARGHGDRARSTPPTRRDDAAWLTVTAWQGGGLRRRPARARRATACYRTTAPMPLGGDWKTLVRLHNGPRRRSARRSSCPRTRRSRRREIPAAGALRARRSSRDRAAPARAQGRRRPAGCGRRRRRSCSRSTSRSSARWRGASGASRGATTSRRATRRRTPPTVPHVRRQPSGAGA